MIASLYALLRPLLLSLDAERAHTLTLHALERLPLPASRADDAGLAVEAFGLRFPNPVGLAAGFDKNARVIDPMLRLGFGFVEVGTLTPRPQQGNPKPRLFRLAKDGAVINRLGFNNDGHASALRRLSLRSPRGIVGINIGANKDSEDKVSDYVAGVRNFAGFASYFTLNVSSPNTPGLRDLQKREALDALLARVIDAREDMAQRHPRRPVLLKIAPDVSLGELDDIVAVALRRGLDGMIVSNTTIARPGHLHDTAKTREAGGLSGAPLFDLSTRMLAETAARVEKRFPLIGVGGIASIESALEKLKAGATLLQLYSGLVFEGPRLIARLKSGLARHVSNRAEAEVP